MSTTSGVVVGTIYVDAARPRPGTLHISRMAAYVGLSAFTSSGMLLVLQQVSFRLLAPIIGSSLETWSAIIGTFLLGIAVGNVAGGQLADRGDPLGVLRQCWRASFLGILLMPLLSDLLLNWTTLQTLPLSLQIGLTAGLVCFPASFALSMLTPPAVRMLMRSSRDSGRVAGLIFALGTAGSLVGNYLTGFLLIPHFDIYHLVYAAAILALPFCLPFSLGSVSAAGEKSNPASSASIYREPDFARRWPFAIGLVFLASFVSGTLESAAFRMLAPLAGFSIFLSTGVVGVILAGMSLGNFFGGRWADSADPAARLRQSFGWAALFIAVIAPVLRTWSINPWLDALPPIPKILFWSFTLFLVPSFFLGTISPLVIRLTVSNLNKSGEETGRIYAWSTLGCIVGILGTGWFFIEWLGVYRLTALCAALLCPPAILARETKLAELWKTQRVAWLAFGCAALFWVALIGSPYDLETRYFSIKVLSGQREGRDIKRLVLDHLIHSDVDLTDPNWLGYKHEAVQGEFTRAIARRVPRPEVLVIGGGGYTYPRWVEHQPELKNVHIQVVEIDPGVTEVAHKLLGLPRETRIASHHLDGRQFVRQAPAETYQLVIQDAVNDYSVPYHLMTREYNHLIRRTLTPDGVYLLTVIDSVTDGPFLRAAVRTMQQEFDDVRLLSPLENWDDPTRAVFVIAGFQSRETADQILSTLDSELVHGMPGGRLTRLLEKDGPRGLVLSDRHAPVESLMSGVYLK